MYVTAVSVKVLKSRFSKSINSLREFHLQARSQPIFSGKPEGPFCLSCTFIFRNERNWMKKSARFQKNW